MINDRKIGKIVDNQQEKVKIFISYARKDEDVVDKLYSDLANAGFQPWMDTKDILAGQDWSRILRKTIKDSHLFIFCISRNSVDKRGFINLFRAKRMQVTLR